MTYYLATSPGLDPHQIAMLFLALAVLLGAARLLGEIMRWFGQPPVIGEILAGILLGPTVLGGQFPQMLDVLFPASGSNATALEGFIVLAVVLLLLVAGLEVDLSVVWRQGKAAVLVSLTGMFFPFVIGFGLAWLAPRLLGMAPNGDVLPFALFIGIAMSITALPVIAKILIDLKMFRSDMGMLIMSAAMVNDLAGWMGFAIVLAMISHAPDAGSSVYNTLFLTLLFLVGMLGLGRSLFHRALPWIQAHTSWPGGVLTVILVITLLCAALTEWIGVHAIFGAFIAGVALGDSSHLRERTRETIHQFVMNIFAPVFFASIGLHVDFRAAFDPMLVVIVLVVAIAVKVGGCYLGAVWAGMNRRESLAVGFGMSARGAMEIVLGQLARQAGLITDELFVAIIIMAMVTSLLAGPMMQLLLQHRAHKTLVDALSARQLIPWLQGRTAGEVIAELSSRAAELVEIEPQIIERAVLRREKLMNTGLGNELAVPHARLIGLKAPVVVVGRSERGIDFNARDARPARLIFLLLTPSDDQTAQIELLRMIAEAFGDAPSREKGMAAKTFTEFLAATKLPGEEGAG